MQVTLQAAELASELLTFSVGESVAFDKVDLNDVVLSANELWIAISRDRANLILELSEAEAFVYANRLQLQQVIFNLIHNSIEADSEFRDVRIATGRRQLHRDQLGQTILGEGCVAGEFCYVKISDKGIGIDPESIRRMFEPSFTSKLVGRGLGLASVLAIVRSCNGAIDVKSSTQSGTTVTIFLPTCTFKSDDDQIEDMADENRTITVLFVDKEPIIRESARRVLEMSRFRVVCASNTEDALKIANSTDERLDCAVVDKSMPGKNGIWLATELKQKKPQTVLILTSGFAEPQDNSDLFDDVLLKPYFPNQLVEAVSKAVQVD